MVLVRDMGWAMLEAAAARDDRCVLPLGSTEQHAALSLATDAILAERVAAEAAEPLGLPVFPVLPYGMTPQLAAFPGTITLRVETYARLLRDILDSLHRGGFRRIVVVNGHGGNIPAHALALEWLGDRPDARLRWHDWYAAPRVQEAARAIDTPAHANWFENFPFTRLPGAVPPGGEKPRVDMPRLRTLPPEAVRAALGDGNYGGRWQRADADMHALWAVAVEETREAMERW